MRAGPARHRPSLTQNAGGCRSLPPYVRHPRYAARYGHEYPPSHAACSYARTVSSILPYAGHARTNRNSGCNVPRRPCRYPHCTRGCHREQPGPPPGGTASFPLPDVPSYRTWTRPRNGCIFCQGGRVRDNPSGE